MPFNYLCTEHFLSELAICGQTIAIDCSDYFIVWPIAKHFNCRFLVMMLMQC